MQTVETKKIFAALQNKARFVGGCVRNSLLGIDVTDIDIATEHKPEKTMQLLKDAGIKVVPTGIEHGTVTAVLNGQGFEITTLRRDVACDGRHAEVEFTDDWQEDAARRDFTINAMSCDADGKIYDYFNGHGDLAKGLVRFVGDAENRVREDNLRILRFFRFNAYYGKGAMHADSLAACAKFAEGIKDLSGERIQAEMLKLLAAPAPLDVLKVMDDKGVMQYLFPLKISMVALERLVANKFENMALLRLAALIGERASQEDLKALIMAWKLSNKDGRFLKEVLFPEFEFSEHMSLPEQRKATRKVGKEIFEAVVLANCTDGDICAELLRNMKNWDIPVFPVGGKELKALGIAEGKEMGDILRDAEKWWEGEGYAPSAADIIEYITKNRR